MGSGRHGTRLLISKTDLLTGNLTDYSTQDRAIAAWIPLIVWQNYMREMLAWFDKQIVHRANGFDVLCHNVRNFPSTPPLCRWQDVAVHPADEPQVRVALDKYAQVDLITRGGRDFLF